jgi:hypothetical protein
MEVMGLMLGEFVDDYTVRAPVRTAGSAAAPVKPWACPCVWQRALLHAPRHARTRTPTPTREPCGDPPLSQVRVVDVFAMPQSGTGVSVEAVDPVFQTKMLDMLKQTGRWGGGLLHCGCCGI